MKPPALIIFLFLFAQIAMAQCTVSIGEDIHYCQTLQATSNQAPPLGEQLQITNATPPYTYAWSIEPIEPFFGTTNLHASTFLDDTTLASPTLLSLWDDSMTFFLQVEDVNQQVCYDTVIVSASIFGTHLGALSFYINAGDSVLLFGGPNVSSNYPIDSLVWRPSIGLSDSTVATPMASPPTTQDYRCAVWDSQGCYQEGSPFQTVVVSPVGIEENAEASTIQVYSQHQELIVNATTEVLPYQLNLWDTQGRLVLSKNVVTATERIATNGFGNGVYLYGAQTEHRLLQSGKLLLN